MKQIEDIQKKNPFKVPDGYFESLTERTLSAIHQGEGPVAESGMVRTRRIKPAPFLALAAAITGFAVITSVMVRTFSDKGKVFKQLSENEIYTERLAEEIDTYMIEDELTVSSVEANGEETLTDETIIEYLLLENIELTEIYEILQ